MVETFILADNIVVNTDSETISIDNKEVKLRPQCHRLLVVLARLSRYGRVATPDIIGAELWSADGGWGEDKKQSLKDCVTELRKQVPYVKNVRGTGYKLDCEVIYVPSFILGNVRTGKTRTFYEFAFDSLKLKANDIRGQFTLVALQASQLLEDVNQHIETCTGETTQQKVIKSKLIQAKASLETVKIEISQNESELEKTVNTAIALFNKVKNNEVDFEETKIDRACLKDTYTYFWEWCSDAKFRIEVLRNTIEETLGLKDDFMTMLNALIEAEEQE